MKNVKFLFFLLFHILIPFFLMAQSGPDTAGHNWQAGERVPDIILSGIKNFSKSTLHLSDLKDKVLILDFWASHCASCVKSFPHLEEMQERFKDKLLIILVNNEEDALVNTFLKKMERITGQKVKLPMINGDSILAGEFKHDGVPHVVWIHQGYLRGITAASRDLNDSNILAVSHGENIFSSIKLLDFGKNTPTGHLPLFVNGNGGDGSGIQYLSVLSKYIPDASSTYCFESTEFKTVTNFSIKYLYQMAYNDDGQYVPHNRTILDVKDSSKYTGQPNNPNDSDRLYTYQLYVPHTSRERFFGMMRADLARYFGLKARLEKRKMLCYVLSAEDSSLLVSGPKPDRWGARSVHDFEIYYQNGTVSDLIGRIVHSIDYFVYSKYPMVDHTEIIGNVEIILECDVSNPNALDKALYEKYKMHLKLQESTVDVLILSE